MCWVYVCIGNGVDGLGLSVCEMREQDQGNKVQEVRWTGMGLSVRVCARQQERQTERSHVSPHSLSASLERTRNVIYMHYLHDLIK